jgi:hypothetical protein
MMTFVPYSEAFVQQVCSAALQQPVLMKNLHLSMPLGIASVHRIVTASFVLNALKVTSFTSQAFRKSEGSSKILMTCRM